MTLTGEECSNRTFMELKYGNYHGVRSRPPGSNRTFMELKYEYKRKMARKYGVLIVPLWN